MPHPAPLRPALDALRLDRWAQLAARLLAMPGAGLWFGGRLAASFGDVPLADEADPFCALAREEAADGVVLISDARKDKRVAAHEAVARGLVCYVGRALCDARGEVRGVLFGLDRRTRRLSDQDLADFQQLAGLAQEALFHSGEASAPVEQAERVHWAETLARAESELVSIERMKSEFLNAASHELRTPLSAILGYAEFLEDCLVGPLNDEQRGFVTEIQNSAIRLRHIVDHMLDLGRLEARAFKLAPSPTDIRQLIQNELTLLEPQALAAGVALAALVPQDPLELALDPQRVAQVVRQLIDNAIKFTPPGGRIRVSAEREGDAAYIRVSDDGIGIPPEALPRLFSKFYQVDAGLTRPRNGAGLGLAISKALVEAHRGTIGVESRPGSGSTFWFTLPLGGD